MRARIDVSEIEAKTKIRAKYLRALENEEWGLLPGPTFVKSFLRTYAQALGLDGKALVEEYRLHHEGPTDALLEPIVSTPQSTRRSRTPLRARAGGGGRGAGGDGPSRGYMIAVSVIGLVIVVLVVALIAEGGGSPKAGTGVASTATTGGASHSATHQAHPRSAAHSHGPTSQLVALSLKPTAVVYVCLLGDDGRRLIPGVELQPGEPTPTYHARRFEITLGNSAVTMIVDGIPRTVAPSSEAIGYSITKANGRRPLAPDRLPTCA